MKTLGGLIAIVIVLGCGITVVVIAMQYIVGSP